MNRAVARRLAALVSATLVSGAGVALVAPAASAAPVVSIVSSSEYVDSAGTNDIVGEVHNGGSTNIEQVVVNVQFLDASDNPVGSAATTNAMLDRLAPNENSPFLLTFSPPAGYDHYSATVSAVDVAAAPNHNFTTSLTKSTDAFGLPHLGGTVRNDNLIDADFVTVVVTFYDASHHVVNAASEYVNDDTIAPGASSVIDETFDPTPSYASYVAVAESNSDSMPGATPSPTPSPTASAGTPSPNPSASTGPDVTPTVSLGSTVISAGQRVTVTYHGAPNTTLRILSKTQPATAYTQITAVALDADGFGSTSHAPTKNTRIMAQTLNGTSSTQPLIQVRSVASLNASRVGTRTYTFSGRVYPALANRLVSLYRNGSLVAQARCNASGIYTVTRTLAAGTFSFQAKTANDTYNLGTTSPAHSYRIS